MKKVIFLFALAIIASFTLPPERIYVLKETQAIQLFDAINIARPALLNSSLPSVTVQQSLKVFDSIQLVLMDQYKKFNPDTTHKKK